MWCIFSMDDIYFVGSILHLSAEIHNVNCVLRRNDAPGIVLAQIVVSCRSPEIHIWHQDLRLLSTQTALRSCPRFPVQNLSYYSTMAPTPIPKAPLHPVVETANLFWGKASGLMKWFTKLVTKAYAYSDFFIDGRQKGADQKYKFEKAEKEAFKILDEQKKQRAAAAAATDGKKIKKRSSGEEGNAADAEGEFDIEDFKDALNELLEEFVELLEEEFKKVEETSQ